MTKIMKKWQSQKILVVKIFWSESIQNALERILKQKSHNRTFFLCKIFSWDFVFSAKMTKIVKKWQSKKIARNFLAGIDSECFATYFKTKISKSKIFSRVKFFSWDFVFSAKMTKIVKNDKIKKNGRKYFLVGIDSECFKTYFRLKVQLRRISCYPCPRFERWLHLYVALAPKAD